MLRVEYAQIVNWPRWVSRITNPEAANKLTDMGRDSMRHFDTTFAIIRKLGGTPFWGFGLEFDKDESDLRQTLLNQLDKEKLAKMGYQRAAELASDEDLRQVLLKQTSDEERHISLLEQALTLL